MIMLFDRRCLLETQKIKTQLSLTEYDPKRLFKKKNDEKFQNLTQPLLLTSLSLAILPFTPKDFKLETAPPQNVED